MRKSSRKFKQKTEVEKEKKLRTSPERHNLSQKEKKRLEANKKKAMQENLPELTGIVSTLKKPASPAPQAFPPGYITTGKFHNTED